MQTYTKNEGELYQFSDCDIESAEEVDGDVGLKIINFDNSYVYLSKEDLLHLLKLIEKIN